MKLVEIGEGLDEDEGENQVEVSVIEQQSLPDEDGQEDLWEIASFVTARFSFSSSSSSSSSSSPAFPLSPSYTPLHQRLIGRDIEERVCFDWLPFTYEEWYGHPNSPAVRAAAAECGPSSADLLADHPAEQSLGAPHTFASRPLRPTRIRVVVRVFKSDGYQNPSFSWNPLNLLRSRTERGWLNNRSNYRRALKYAIGIPGTQSAMLDIHDGTITITGEDVDPVLCVKALRRKRGWAEILEVEHGLETPGAASVPTDNAESEAAVL